MALNLDASFVDHLAPSVAAQFVQRVEATPHNEAYQFPVADGQPWKSMTWAETGKKVDQLAAGLLALGIEPEQRIGIASTTRIEWIWADLAVLCAGAATTTVYPTTMAADVSYILSDSQCRIVFAEDDTQIEKLREQKAEIPDVFKVITFDGTPDGDWVISLDELQRLGVEHLEANPNAVKDTIANIKPENLATLIYTSGTTGRPKGVRINNRSWVYEGAAVKAQGILTVDDVQFLWLPLAHSFGKVLLSAQFASGFITAVDGRIDRIIDNLAIVKPTFMGAAPRIFEKAYARVITAQAAEGGIKEKLFLKAFEVGRKVDQLTWEGKPIPLWLKLQHRLFDRLVFAKVRERFGGRVRFFISGAAALNQDIAEWFHAAGILILEGYGLTESSAGSFVNHPDAYKFGTVGMVFPGSEVKISPEGEVLIKGPGVMEGYHNLPEDTQASLSEDGWLHTGDQGHLDDDGFLTITGRIKELFKTSGGKYIAPPAIEAKFKSICPYASQFMVFGSERQYVVALVTLDEEAMEDWANENGHGGKSFAELMQLPEVHAMVDGYVEELNRELNRWETIKKWALLDYDLSVESGELTPSMKVKRNVVEKNHAELLDSLY